MTPAITLSREEKSIAERQCAGCMWWGWFEGCSVPAVRFDRTYPLQDCGAFEEAPNGCPYRGAVGQGEV
ncbi:hypothetical protein LCGC14_0993030 [marine sediment metagenome]|uniref:Uncharacterized protein n=1 Tax=marine sediment metagenome TaxID=412755 RepID=A0A0F9N593_9ZZZZ